MIVLGRSLGSNLITELEADVRGLVGVFLCLVSELYGIL